VRSWVDDRIYVGIEH